MPLCLSAPTKMRQKQSSVHRPFDVLHQHPVIVAFTEVKVEQMLQPYSLRYDKPFATLIQGTQAISSVLRTFLHPILAHRALVVVGGNMIASEILFMQGLLGMCLEKTGDLYDSA